MQPRHQVNVLMLLTPFAQRRLATPKSDESCGRVTPLVVAIRTASGQNASAYLFAIGSLFHSKYYAKDAGTKPGLDQ